MADITAVQNTSTLNKYIKSQIDPIFRSSVVMGGLEAHGCITYGKKNSGKSLKWRPRVKRRSIKAADPNGVSITFQPTNTRMEVSLPWCSYNLGERVSKMDKLINQGDDVQYVNHVEDTIDGLSEDFREDFSSKIYIDGSATGSNDVHGFETMFSVNGLVTDGRVGDPDGTYAGKSTALGYLGGNWTGTFPSGRGKTHYHAWSPLVVDYNNDGFDATSHAWSGQWQQVLNFAVAHLGRLQKAKPDIALINTDMLIEAKDSLRASERFIATPKSKMTDAGFVTIMFENLEIADEYNVPDETGYLFSWKNIELKSMQNQLVELDDDHITASSVDIYAADFYGQFKFNAPSQFCKLAAISAES